MEKETGSIRPSGATMVSGLFDEAQEYTTDEVSNADHELDRILSGAVVDDERDRLLRLFIPEQAEKHLKFLATGFPPEARISLQTLGPSRAYFQPVHTFVNLLDRIRPTASSLDTCAGVANCYARLNPVKPESVDRIIQRERDVLDFFRRTGCTYVEAKEQGYAFETVTDRDVERIINVLIDIDAIRQGTEIPSGTKPSSFPSTDEEHQQTLRVADLIVEELRSWGLTDLMYCLVDSGNGHQIDLKVDMQSDKDSYEVRRLLLAYFGSKYGEAEGVEIDTSVVNAGRLCRLAGTLNIKKNQANGRMNRTARLVHCPEGPEAFDLAGAVGRFVDDKTVVQVNRNQEEKDSTSKPTETKERQSKACAKEKPRPAGRIPKPVMTERIELLRKNCERFRSFEKDPTDSNCHRDEWNAWGILLAQPEFGDAGPAWFQYISAKDRVRYEDDWDEPVQAMRQKGLSAPSCAKFGCELCDFRSPMEAAGIRKKNWREVPAKKVECSETVTADAVSAELKDLIHEIVREKKPEIYVVKTDCGVGKTEQLIRVLEETGVRILLYLPTHALMDEVGQRFTEQPFSVYGWKHIFETAHCPHKEEIKDKIKRHLPHEKQFCTGMGICPKKDNCEFIKQFPLAEDEQVVLLSHAHQRLGKQRHEQLVAGRDLIVFDEDPTTFYRRESELKEKDLCSLKNAIHIYPVGKKIIGDWIDPLLAFLKGKQPKLAPLHPIKVSSGFLRTLYAHFEGKSAGPCVLPLLMSAVGSRAAIRRFRRDGQWVLSFSTPFPMPRNVPVIILDGTGDIESYRLLFGDRKVNEVDPLRGRRLKTYGRTIQCVSGGYPNASLIHTPKDTKMDSLSDSGERVVQFIEERITDRSDTAVICTKKLRALIEPRLVGVRFVHYGNQRGIDSLSEIGSLFVVGYQGISYETMAQEASVLFDVDLDVEREARALLGQKEWVPINCVRDGMQVQVRTLVPRNAYVKAFYQLRVSAEVEQAVGRLRMCRPRRDGEPQTLYLLTNLPTSLPIDEIVEMNAEKEPDHLETVVLGLIGTGQSFTSTEIKHAADVNSVTLSRRMNALAIKHGLQRRNGPHGIHVYERAA